MADFDAATRLSPEYAIPFANRGVLYNAQKHYEAAIAEFDHAIRLNPNYGSAFYGRGVAHEGLEQLSKARADFLKDLQLEPGDPDSSAALARLEAKQAPAKRP